MSGLTPKIVFIHKLGEHQSYGGPEEGGWYYDLKYALSEDHHAYMIPIIVGYTDDDEQAYEICRQLHKAEYERRDRENTYKYTNVLAYKENFYTFDFCDSLTPPETTVRPHYE